MPWMVTRLLVKFYQILSDVIVYKKNLMKNYSCIDNTLYNSEMYVIVYCILAKSHPWDGLKGKT